MATPNPAFIGLPRTPPRAPMQIFIDPTRPTTLRATLPPNPAFLGLDRQSFAPINPNQGRYHRLTRDDRLIIQTLQDAGHSNADIQRRSKFSKKSIQYTLKHRLIPQHSRAGRPPKISEEEGNALEAFVTASKRNRRLTYAQLLAEFFPHRLFGPNRIGVEAVKNCLERRGFRRCVALRKPVLSEANRIARKAWANEHIHWTMEQWNRILWSDET